MEKPLTFESTYASAAAVTGADLDRARRYARWTLRGETFAAPALAAACAADKILRRAALVPAPSALEAPLRAMLGPRMQAGLRACHQIQTAAVRHGEWFAVETDLSRAGTFSGEEARALVALALADLSGLWEALTSLYPDAPAESGPLFLSFAGALRPGWTNMIVEDEASGEAEPFLICEGERDARDNPAALQTLLRRLFGHEAFREGQAEALTALLAGRDTVALLATGAGKSLIAQLAALLRPGAGLIVEPLLSIVADQRRALTLAGIGAVGDLSVKEDREALAAGRLVLAYASPERLDTAALRAALREAAEHGGVAFVALDEAHCAAEWGHDFRPALLSAGRRARRWAEGPWGAPPLAGFTGTASAAQLPEIAAVLEAPEAVVVARPLSRPELAFEVERCGRGEHAARLRAWLSAPGERRFGCGLVFCPAVEGPLGAAAIQETLLWGENIRCGLFPGRAPARENVEGWPLRKAAMAGEFLGGRLDWLCCTSAFGLGVDVPRARYTVHLGLPRSLEGFFQEAGRAGRDGLPALCRVLLRVDDERAARRWLDPGAAYGELVRDHARVPPGRRDDAWAAFARHAGAFAGVDSETADAAWLLRASGPPRVGRAAAIDAGAQARGPLMRAASRLESAGFCETALAGNKLELLWLVEATASEALDGARAVIANVYERVEPARRRSLARMLELVLEEGETFADALAGL